MKVTMKMKIFKCQKIIIQAIKKVTEKFLTFFLVKILVMNGYQTYFFAKNLFWNVVFLHLWSKPWKLRVKGSFLVMMQAYFQQLY